MDYWFSFKGYCAMASIAYFAIWTFLMIKYSADEDKLLSNKWRAIFVMLAVPMLFFTAFVPVDVSGRYESYRWVQADFADWYYQQPTSRYDLKHDFQNGGYYVVGLGKTVKLDKSRGHYVYDAKTGSEWVEMRNVPLQQMYSRINNPEWETYAKRYISNNYDFGQDAILHLSPQ